MKLRRDDTTLRTHQAYERCAPAYARANQSMPHELARAAGHLHVLVGDGARVLDVGCGAGRDMAWLESLGLSLTGVDNSMAMLLQARSRVRGPLARMDMRQLGLASGSFSAVWCSAALLHLGRDQAPQALSEIKRVLHPGGFLFLSVQHGEGEVWEASPYGPGERFFCRYSRDELLRVLSGTGYEVESVQMNVGERREWLECFCRARA